MQIDSNTIPAAMADSGNYIFDPAPILRQRGTGIDVVHPGAVLIWQWAALTKTEMSFWQTTILGGEISIESSGTHQLYDDNKDLVTYSYCIVDRPTWARFANNIFYDVEIQIRAIQ